MKYSIDWLVKNYRQKRETSQLVLTVLYILYYHSWYKCMSPWACLLKGGTHPTLPSGPWGPAGDAQRRPSSSCSFPSSTPGGSGHRCLDLCVWLRLPPPNEFRGDSSCGYVLGLPSVATAVWTVAEGIWIVAMGGICMRFPASRFLEVQTASFMATRVSQSLENSFVVLFLRLTP